MAERYTKMFSLEGMLYAQGAPVVITDGHLLSDNLTKNTVVQLRLRNISDKVIKSVKVVIDALDEEGAAMWMPVEHQYNDLKAKREDSFGKNSTIMMPDKGVQSFSAAVSAVYFADGSIWEGAHAEWYGVKAPRTITEALGDEELSHQFAIRYGSDCSYLPEDEGGLWFCACGAINIEADSKCHRCRRVYSALKAVNLASLRSETQQRVEMEKQSDDEEKAESKKRRSLYTKLAFILVPVIAVAILVLATVPGFLAQKNAYEDAHTLLSAGKYDQAQMAFEALGNYNDSAEIAQFTIPYKKACYIMGCAKAGDVQGLIELGMKRSELAEDETISVALYKQAADMFLALGDYMDSAQQREFALSAVNTHYESLKREAYDAAVALMESGSYCQARDAFLGMSEYADSAELAQEAMYRRAVKLYELTEKYFLQGVDCKISSTTGESSVFYISESAFAKLGKEASSDIRDILREDGVEINIKDTPEGEGFIPVCRAISQLFTDMGSYKDSADYVSKALANGDFTKPFYDYCTNGQLLYAYQWLLEYDEEFEYREQWLGILQSYIPYCGVWELKAGDPSLIPMTLGAEAKCNNFTSLVTIKDGVITLRLLVAGFENYPIELPLNVGSNNFSVCNDGFSTFVAVISNKGDFQYSRYLNSGLQAGTYSCEYARIG